MGYELLPESEPVKVCSIELRDYKLLANLFLYSYEVEFLRSMNKSNKKLAKAFNLTSRYTDDLISINNPRFKQFLKDTQRSLWSQRHQSREMSYFLCLSNVLCHSWIY